MAKKKPMTIQERDWMLHLERLKRGFINRWYERRSTHPRRKNNCRKLTPGRFRWRKDCE